MVMQRMESSTQTDPEVHDVFYYKSRAHKAEEALLLLKMMQYIGRLQAELRELERETSNNMQLYSYDPEKRQQLQQEFQYASLRTDQLCRKSEEIFAFNIQSLLNGHELSELPMVDDANVDLSTFKLGPVTPTIGPRNPLLPVDGSGPTYPGSSMVNGTPLPFPDLKMYQYPPSPFYTFYRQPEHIPASFNPESVAPGSAAVNFTLPIGQRSSAVGSNRSNIQFSKELPPGTFTNPGGPEELLQTIQLKKPLRAGAALDPMAPPASLSFFPPSSHASTVAGVKPPDVIPKNLLHADTANDRTSVLGQADLSISGAMGLDSLDLECSLSASSAATRSTWSDIAGLDTEIEGEWQAVGSKKTKPGQLSNKVQPSRSTTGGLFSDNSNFEKVVEGAMEKYQLTRPEVIAALQKVRNDRNGHIDNVPLHEMMKEAEKLLGSHKAMPKSTSLTARARAVAGHPEPCDNQLCPARLKLLKYRTELCLSYQTSRMCYMKPGSCVYAHGEAELRPLPKEEPCERYIEGKCSNARCVYAHGVSELKNRVTINPAEYLSRKNKKAVMSNNTNKASMAEDLSLTAADKDAKGEECAICFDTMSKKSRRALDCGHDSFHYKCLKKWVGGEGDRSCPLCRSNTLLPEEYPKLGSR